MFQEPHGVRGLHRVDPDLEGRYARPQTFRERSAGTLIGLGIAIGLLVALSIVGRFL